MKIKRLSAMVMALIMALMCFTAFGTALAETAEPAPEPTAELTPEPTAEPTAEPTTEPTTEPTAEPTTEPTTEPTVEPTTEPTTEPTVEPTTEPTTEPTVEPTIEPTAEPEAPEGWWRDQATRIWYYYENGQPLVGYHDLEGYKPGGGTQINTYKFNEDGSLFTGFQKIDGDWYFFGERGFDPKTSRLGQMIKNYYVESPKEGYISAGEKEQIAAGKTREYRYYFDVDGKMITGWFKGSASEIATFDTTDTWRYFGREGSSPKSSRLGRICKYGMVQCIGNDPGYVGRKNYYMFSQTGGMMTGVKTINGEKWYFNKEGENPAKDRLGMRMTYYPVESVRFYDSNGWVRRNKYLSLDKGDNLKLIKSLNPTNATSPEVVWKSSDTSVCTVTQTGIVKGVGKGYAKVSCTSVDNPKAFDECYIAVIDGYTYAKKSNDFTVDLDGDGKKERVRFSKSSIKTLEDGYKGRTITIKIAGATVLQTDIYGSKVGCELAYGQIQEQTDYTELFLTLYDLDEAEKDEAITYVFVYEDGVLYAWPLKDYREGNMDFIRHKYKSSNMIRLSGMDQVDFPLLSSQSIRSKRLDVYRLTINMEGYLIQEEEVIEV